MTPTRPILEFDVKQLEKKQPSRESFTNTLESLQARERIVISYLLAWKSIHIRILSKQRQQLELLSL